MFFTSSAELTADADTGSFRAGNDLYDYDTEAATLTDLTPDSNPGDADGAAVQGVVGMSESGSYVYFVAEGDLAPGATSGMPNLYYVHEGGAPKFVATLEAGDSDDWTAAPLRKTVALTADGTHLAFDSVARLTGYDNLDVNTGVADKEVYEYSAPSGEEEATHRNGRLVCVSCNPSGARPIGYSTLDPPSSENYARRSISEDGDRVFFDSYDRLLAQDTSGPESFFGGAFAFAGERNVYEYESGHLYLISDGAGEYDSYFLDASADGDDVFIATRDKLLPEDVGENMTVYDARTEGGFPAPEGPACAREESCPGALSPPPVPAGEPASATFVGAGNLGARPSPPKHKTQAEIRAEKLKAALKACRRKARRVPRVRCEKSAHRRYGRRRRAVEPKRSGGR
ncbi:MAG TPA: hypothetical protein VKV16_00265 [Solirubrobacteraceae bacterium]|nr:hypothetical protein [Solirubrobacteraceae bacterium]